MNARGECNIWLPPNTAFKFVLQDAFSNTIWTVDQIVNSQLTTLYGGVDTGVANAYVLTFVAPFSAYADGEIVYWIPANANTGASTININGLGVIAIVNPNGNPLQAGQITANLVAAVLIKGGQALLIQGGSIQLLAPGLVTAPSLSFLADNQTGFYQPGAGQIGVALSGVGSLIATGALAGSYAGLTGATFGGSYAVSSNLCMLRIAQASGTSNATTFTMTLTTPAVRPFINQFVSCPAMQDNGSALYAQVGYVAPGSGTTVFTFFKNGNSSGWTNSGTKGIGDGGGAQNYTTFTYLLT